jgi:outer membrane receptor for ferrienterochelin and colicins
MSRNLLRSYLQYDVFWSEKNRFTFGTEYTIDDISGTRYPDKPSFRTFSGFMQWEGNPTSWISYALSARYVQNSAYKNPEFAVSEFAKSLVNIINPKYSLNIKVTEEIRLNSSIGTGFKVPDFRQLYVQFSNRLGGAGYDLIGSRRLGFDLQPERSIAYDAGIIYDNQSLLLSDSKPISVFFECRYFVNQLSNLIEFYFVKSDPISNQSIYSYRNISRALTSGIDISTRWILPLSKTDNQSLGITLGYQYLDTKDLEVVDAIKKGIAGTVSASNGTFKPLTENEYGGLWFRSKHTGTIRLEYTNPEYDFSFNIRAQMIGRFGDEALDNNGPVISNRKVPDLDNEYIQGYTIINAAMSKEFDISDKQSTLMISIGINNALNSMNLQFIPNMIGRQLFVNSSITL